MTTKKAMGIATHHSHLGTDATFMAGRDPVEDGEAGTPAYFPLPHAHAEIGERVSS
jgi:hypothetical protein